MRRRADAVDPKAAVGRVPAVLRSMAGVVSFVDELEPVPSWWSRDTETWRHLAAYRRWSNARRRWAADNGVDYVAVFHPEWRRCS